MDNIILVGFMASGKSHVGRILAERTGMPLVDADAVIVERAGKSIEQIFADDGEAAFRSLERQVIADLCGGSGRIFCCGAFVDRQPAGYAGGRDGILSPGEAGDHLPAAQTTNRGRRCGHCWRGRTRWGGFGSC